MLRPSLDVFGIDTTNPDRARDRTATLPPGNDDKPRNWRDLWSAGHSISGVHDIPTVADLTERLISEYQSSAGSWSRLTEAPVG
jgi:nitronate monooxygenase